MRCITACSRELFSNRQDNPNSFLARPKSQHEVMFPLHWRIRRFERDFLQARSESPLHNAVVLPTATLNFCVAIRSPENNHPFSQIANHAITESLAYLNCHFLSVLT